MGILVVQHIYSVQSKQCRKRSNVITDRNAPLVMSINPFGGGKCGVPKVTNPATRSSNSISFPHSEVVPNPIAALLSKL